MRNGTGLKGKIAVCSQGHLGLITEDGLKLVKYSDTSSALAYVGVHLAGDKIGQPWSSRNLRVLGEIRSGGNVVEVINAENARAVTFYL